VHQVSTKNPNFASLFPPCFLGVVKEGGGKQWSFLNFLIEPRVDNVGYHKKI